MTAVLWRMLALLLALAAFPAAAGAQAAGPAVSLYRKLRSVGLDPAAVYRVRDAALDREDIHITLDDGVIAFTQAVDGRVTGAFFEGEGEVLLVPPNQVERGSLALFSGAAVLEEKITTAYLRFNDDTAAQLQAALRPAEQPQEFLEKWDGAARALAEGDALRLLATFLNGWGPENPDRMLRARLQGTKLGIFDVFYDSLAGEQIAIEKLSYRDGIGYYDVLASFPMRSSRVTASRPEGAALQLAGTTAVARRFHVAKYKIATRVQPPTSLDAEAALDVEVSGSGDRICFFELSRFLKVRTVEADGRPVEFLQNEALEGSDLSRRGNDVVAVVFPEPLRAGQLVKLRFVYGGTVLAEAGAGLLYVGARGIWFPNRGFTMADFELEFRYPPGWTLVATGKLSSQETRGEEQVSRWVSERPIPVAGFNLGKYRVETVKAGDVLVQAYATPGVERTFPAPRATVTANTPSVRVGPEGSFPRDLMPPPLAPPPPTTHARAVAETSARAVEFFARQFGPYPYSTLALSQLPGRNSQGWPGLVFLSSYSFLSRQERAQLRLTRFESLLYDHFMLVHETAHQWWGDLVRWKTYRDQWMVEALANYSAILALEKDLPAECKALLDAYRELLLSKNKDGEQIANAGPVTLGFRLNSSHFPGGFDVVSYGRGTWLLHMLRHMLRDAAPAGGRSQGRAADELFLRVLRRLRDRYEGKEISTQELQQLLEEDLPDSLRFEGKRSLAWFFDGWVNGSAIPRFELHDVKITARQGGSVATGVLLQQDAPQELISSVPIYGQTRGGLVLLARVFADGPETSFRLKVPPSTHKLVIDPYQTVLRRP